MTRIARITGSFQIVHHQEGGIWSLYQQSVGKDRVMPCMSHCKATLRQTTNQTHMHI